MFKNNNIMKFRFRDKDTLEVLFEESMTMFDAKITTISNDCIMELIEK